MIPENLVSRADIVAMTGASKGTVYKVTTKCGYDFPIPRAQFDKKDLWDRKEVQEWLSEHEMPNMRNRNTSEKPYVNPFDNKLAFEVLRRGF